MTTLTVLFTDLVGSTALMTELGDDRFQTLLAEHDALVDTAIAAHDGTRVKHTGDGVMAVFTGATEALSAAVAIQQAVERRNRRAHTPFSVRAGIGAGDVTEQDGDYFGTPVVEAARLCAASEAGQILASEIVKALAGSRGDHAFIPLGNLDLKGLPPLPTTEVQWHPTVDQARLPLPAALARDDGVELIGRDAELERLVEAWTQTMRGERRVAMLSGEPGIGKTRLATELARRVQADGGLVFLGRCEDGFGAPYKPFAEVVSGAMALDPAELSDWAARHGADVARISRAVRERLPQIGALQSADPDTAQIRTCEGVAALLANVASAGALLVLDDLHWADEASLVLLRHLARTDPSLPVMVLGTYRTAEAGTPLADTLADVRRATGIVHVPVSGLSDTATHALVNALFTNAPDAALIDAVSSETEGNPFFVREAVAHYQESGGFGASEGVRQLIGQRLGRLSKPTQRMLGIAAVIGREFDLELLAVVTADDEDVLLDRLDEARTTGLIAERAERLGRFGFSHALVRSTLADSLGATRRVRLHQRVGEAIESLHANSLDAHIAELAYHYGEAASAEPDQAARYAVLAGHQARLVGSYTEARAACARGIELLEASSNPDDALRLDALIDLAWIDSWSADPARATASVEEALTLARRLGSPARLAQVVVGVVPQLISMGVLTPRLRAALEDAAQDVGDGDASAHAQVLAAKAFTTAYGEASEDERRIAQQHAQAAYELASRTGDHQGRYFASIALFELQWNGPNASAAMEAANRAVAGATDAGLRVGTEMSRWRQARAQIRLGDWAGSHAFAEIRDENPLFISISGLLRAALAAAEGRWDDAARLADRALARVPNNPAIALTHSEQDRHSRAEQGGALEPSFFARVVQQRPDFPATYLTAALAAAESGDRDTAAQMIETLAADDFAIVPYNAGRTVVLRYVIDLVSHAGTERQAAVLHSLLTPYDGQMLVAYIHSAIDGAASRGLGQLETVLGRYEAAEAHFEAAIDLEEQMRAPVCVVRTKYWYARMLIKRDATGDADRAAAMLDHVVAETSKLGMRALETQARSLR